MNQDYTSVTEKKKKVNAVDIFLLIMLIASVLAVGYRYYAKVQASDKAALENRTVYFTVEKMYTTLPLYLAEGDTLYFEDGSECGTLASISSGSLLVTTPADITLQDAEGKELRVSDPTGKWLDAEGCFTCRLAKTAEGYYLLNGNRYLTPGDTLVLHTAEVEITLIIRTVS